jgi:hypothetical protein
MERIASKKTSQKELDTQNKNRAGGTISIFELVPKSAILEPPH